jgi:acyl-coenzyme A synthetase/AMP-(fatty) acid ligase
MEQLRAEAMLLLKSVVGEVDRVVNYAPTSHLYGRLLGDIVPACLGVPVQHLWDSPLTVPDLAAPDRTLLVCLPSTWLALRAIAGHSSLAHVIAVHSTGPTTGATRQLLSRIEGSGFRAREILGSTETGAIAHRDLMPRPERPSVWTLFDDVTLVTGPAAEGEHQLRVRSARIARRADMDRSPDCHALDDLIRPAGERCFELLGRSTRMVKINGCRIRLDDVEGVVRARFPGMDLVCIPRMDPVRAEHYDLFYTGDAGNVTVKDIHALLTTTFPGVPVPRRVQRVEAIPRSLTGKVRVDRLLADATAKSGTVSEAIRHAP